MKHKYNLALKWCLLWCFSLLALPSMAQTMSFSVLSTPRGTGSTTDSAITQTSLIKAENTEDGWMIFDISGFQSVSSNFVIDSVLLDFYVDSTNFPYWSLCPMRFDPLTASPDSLKLDISEDESNASTRYAYFTESSSFAPGAYTRNITSPNLVNGFTSAISNGLFPVGVGSTDNSSTYYLRIQGWNEANPPIMTVYYHTVSCALPTNLMASNVTSSSVDVSWTAGDTNTAFGWTIEYDTAGFTPGTGATVFSSSTSYTISGLVDGTNYDIYIYENCSAGSSPVVGPVSIKTLCNAIAAPFADGFENGMHPCFIQDQTDDFDWRVNSGGTTSSATGPSSANEGTFYAYTETSSPVTNGDVARLILPTIDVTGMLNPVLSFDYHLYGAGMGTLSVLVKNGQIWDTVFAKSGDRGDVWFNDHRIQLLSYGPMVEVMFSLEVSATGTAYENDAAIDDIQIFEAPLCDESDSLSSFNVGNNSVDLMWTPGSGSSFAVEYTTPGAGPRSGTMVSAAGSPFTLTGLMPATTYDIFLYDACSTGDTSLPVGPITITTNCNPVEQAPYFEGFEAGIVPVCWSNDPANDFDWEANDNGTVSGSTGPSAASEGNFYLYVESSGSSSNDTAILYLPLVDIDTLTTPAFSFDYHMYGDAMGTLELQSYNGSSWQTIWSMTGDQGDTWYNDELIALTGTVAELRFLFDAGTATPTYRKDVAIDDIKFIEMPTCFPPSGLMVANITGTAADIHWSPAAAGLNFNIEFGPTGFMLGTGVTQVVTMDSMLTLASLSGLTTYDVYVQEDCGNNDLSAWAGPISFTTLATAPYFEGFSGGYPAPGFTEKQGLLKDSTVFSSSSFSSWSQDMFANNTSINDTSARLNVYGTSRDEWMFLPLLDLGTGGSYQLDFNIALTQYNSQSPDTLGVDDTVAVVISTDGGITFSKSNALKIFDHTTYIPDTGMAVTVDLSAYSGIVQIGFYGQSTVTNKDNDVFVDDIHIHDPNAPICGFAAPIAEGFENGLPSVIEQDTTDTFDWTVLSGATGSSGTGPSAANEGSFYIYTETSSPIDSGDVAILNFPGIDFTTLIVPGIQFDYHMFGASMGTLSWEVLDTNTGNWVVVWSKSGDQGKQWFNDAQVQLGAYATCNTFLRLKMLVNGPVAYLNDAAVDDIQFTNVASCIAPSNLQVLGVTDVSVDLSFDPGSGTSYVVEYGPVGFTPGTGTVVNVSVTNPTITGLASATEYDFYVKDDCGTSGTSAWAGPATAKTLSCSAPCFITFTMADSWGDGWNGAYIEVNVSGTMYQVGLFGSADTAGVDSVPVCDGDSVIMTFVSGAYDNEVSYTATDINGNVLVSVSTGSAAAGTVYQGLGTCTSCADPVASFTATLVSSGSSGHDYSFTNNSTTGSAATYFWDFGDGNTSTVMSPSHLYATNGTFDVMLIVTDSCGSDTALQQVVVQGIGLLESLEQSLSMFPNPTAGELTISFMSQTNADYAIRVSNTMGAEVMMINQVANAGKQELTLDLSHLPKGMYLVQLLSEDGHITRRISLQ